ncbi:MAG: aminotransferase class III-fold pyridoxal phosphate-dependent enzyme [Deltaproteobacteria bacterium]|nr:MAG: aminotransferase class III-fold pyridoxal phosphate-dependent enzyme [Deltaproteobacteria bacterium]
MGDARLDAYGDFVKPSLMSRLRAVGLDVEYHRASGDRVWYRDESGAEVEVLDMVGGFGASLLGHNHPQLVAVAQDVLASGRPFHAQGSGRGEAGVLAQRLSERVGRTTGQEYVVTLANSGTEAVEAAMKHAELERRNRAEGVLTELQRTRDAIQLGLLEQRVRLPPRLFKQAARAFGVEQIPTLSELLMRVSRGVLELLEQRPVFFALEGAFHGKTLGSVQLTHNASFRMPWTRVGPRSVFLPREDVDALAEAVEDATIAYRTLAIEGGEVVLVERAFVNVCMAIVEPIQGEGGVVEIGADYLSALRDAADAGAFPLVFDEIQCGMGRTGTFLASEPSGVVPDYVTLAKTLSGGLAKISALLVDARRYEPEFGIAHTSTYAEDHFSSAVANKVLDLLDDEDVPARCATLGARFRDKLDALRARYPDQIVDVRGRGLMVGVELATQEGSHSALLRVLSEQDTLAYLVAGFLLREHGVRVTSTLSARTTLRLQPSAFIAEADLDRFCAALGEALEAMRHSDAWTLSRCLVGRTGQAAKRVEQPAPTPIPPVPPGQTHVGFLAHFLEPEGLKTWDKSLSPFSKRDCEAFLARTEGAIDPFVVARNTLQSATGQAVTVTVIGIPFTPDQAMESLRAGNDWILELIHQGVETARRLGCSLLGFGGYTSILTGNCREVVNPDLNVTSGNSLTAAAGLEAARLAAERLGLEHRRMGIVGAAGNIGAVLADVAADEVDEIVLVGRQRRSRRLDRVVARIYASAQARAREGHDRGIARVMADFLDVPEDQLVDAVNERLGDAAPVRIDDMSALPSCNMVLSATNAPRPVILPEHISMAPTVVVDVAVPTDVAPAVDLCRPDAVVLRGGMVRAPLGQQLAFDGMSLRPGELYGCLAETLLLGVSGVRENFSCGDLNAARVRQVRELARVAGFEIDENRR